MISISARRFLPLIAAIGFSVPAISLSQETDQSVLKEGEDLYLQHCEYCHGKGIGRGATVILDERYGGSLPGSLEDRTNLDGEQVRFYVRNWTPGMASFRPSEISDAQLDVLIAWLTRNNPD
jgi:mono/diheme cytochrome c family protein